MEAEGHEVLPLPAGAGDARLDAPYHCMDDEFGTAGKQREVAGQYANIYFTRLAKLRPCVLAAMRMRWGSELQLSKTLDVPEETECVVLGTLYLDMKLKPNVLEEYTRDPLAPAAPAPDHYFGQDDRYIIEDETGRLVLAGDIVKRHRLVTGIVLAACGRLDESSAFVVSDLCFPAIPPQPPLPPSIALGVEDVDPKPDDRYLAIVSGLRVGGDGDHAHMLALQLLLDYVTGNIGGAGELGMQRRIVRLVIAGGLLGDGDGRGVPECEILKPNRARAQRTYATPLQTLEAMLTPVAACTPVDLMPGEGDPTNYSMPQQPIHHCLLPVCSRYAGFAAVTNPHAFEVANVRVLGTSGQPVLDVRKYYEAGDSDPVQTLEDMLHWRHVAPTAPDTLACFPFSTHDPFIVSECPHILFAANQAKYDTRLVEGPGGQRCRLISVPAFIDHRVAVFVNLRTLRCHPICFDGFKP